MATQLTGFSILSELSKLSKVISDNVLDESNDSKLLTRENDNYDQRTNYHTQNKYDLPKKNNIKREETISRPKVSNIHGRDCSVEKVDKRTSRSHNYNEETSSREVYNNEPKTNHIVINGNVTFNGNITITSRCNSSSNDDYWIEQDKAYRRAERRFYRANF